MSNNEPVQKAVMFKVLAGKEFCVLPEQTELYALAEDAARYYLEVQMTFGFHGIKFPVDTRTSSSEEIAPIVKSLAKDVNSHYAFMSKYYNPETLIKEREGFTYRTAAERYAFWLAEYKEQPEECCLERMMELLDVVRCIRGYSAFE